MKPIDLSDGGESIGQAKKRDFGLGDPGVNIADDFDELPADIIATFHGT